MIQTTELRTGNIIIDLHDRLGKITHIRERSVKYLVKDSDHPFNVEIESIKPIQITIDLLFEYGFDFSDDWGDGLFIQCEHFKLILLYYHPDESMAWGVRLEDYDEDEKPQIIMLPEIQYLHTLQNLVYSITGKELENKVL